MAPGGGGKRKRGDRTYSGDARDDGSRPSPYRPGTLNLGQPSPQQQFQHPQGYGRDHYEQRGGNRRRASRGGRGGASQHSPMNSPNAIPVQQRPNNASPRAMSPSLPPYKPSTESRTETGIQPLTTNSATTQAPSQILTETSPYDYEYITDQRLAKWTETGRRDVVDSGVQACATENTLTLGFVFQEIIRSGIDGRLDMTDSGMMIRDVLGSDPGSDVPSDAMREDKVFDASSIFLDCVSILAEVSTNIVPLRTIIAATGVSPSKMRRDLDSTLLENLGMIRNTFVRMGIRQQTNLLYRQSNYNLLREETEGYSKLLTEFFTTSSNEPATAEVVEETFERVKGMIGAFDLDVGRVLDITLDVFAAVLVKQYRFFVKYLRASSWWPQENSLKQTSTVPVPGLLPRWALPGGSGRPLNEEEKEAATALKTERDQAFWVRTKDVGLAAFFELGGRRVEESALLAATNSASGDLTQDKEDRKWIEITKTLPPPGNKVAAQVLGFKLRFYSSSARDPTDSLPINLIYLAALLIKVGFISLRDLYPHLWPADPEMAGVREEKMKEKAERDKLNRPGGGATNALLAAAPLPDDTMEGKAREATRLRELDAARRHPTKLDQPTDRSTPTTQPDDKADELPEPSEQKVQLLKSLLCIGALPEALYMLGRFPWLPDAFPELPEHIHRILHHSLSKVYDPIRPLQKHPSLRDLQSIPDSDQSGATKGQVKLTGAPARKTMRWAQLDKEDSNEAIDYKFYWDDWADNVPICQTVDDVFTLCSTLLNFTGVKIGLDTVLLLKLARIGIHSLATDASQSNTSRWIDLSKRLIVPALSFTKCNPGVVNEVYDLINKFSIATRYSIYAEWYSGQTSRLPDMKLAFDQAKAETKDVLKRISKTTLKPMARALAKVAYANPGIVFSVAIAQLESYENIVDAVVECARYFTYLAYDVLTWSLMSALGGTGRTRVQADGMLTSKWLAALSLFAGKVFKRYSVMSPTPVVQYVADQLRRGNSTDLIILEEITKSMAGVISDTNFNEAQVLAMAGGELLQAQTLLQLLDRRHESKHTAKRLMRSLTDSRLAGQILVSLAQERQTGIFRIEEQNAHPKLLGNLFDQLHRILIQYADLLRSNLSISDFDFFVPGVAPLITQYGIDPSVAFWISRPSIAAAMIEYDAKIGKRNSDVGKSPTQDASDAISKSETEPTAVIGTNDDNAQAVQTEDDMKVPDALADGVLGAEDLRLDSKETKEPSPESSSAPVKVETAQQLSHPVLRDLMEDIRPALPAETWEILSLPFYVTFWYLSLADMQPPLSSYKDEIDRLGKKVGVINNDRSDISIAGTKRKEKEKAALMDLQDRLSAESTTRVNHYTAVRGRNLKEKDHWFAGFWGKWDALNVALIEYCFFPRILMSPLDALYTFRMFNFLHANGATNFRTMGVLDQIFREKRLTSMMFLCTAKEAENLGRFLNEVLRMLSKWHASKTVFEKEAFGTKKELPGFMLKMSSDKSQFTFLDYENFRRILLKWHRNLSSAIKTCINSGEYMHIRNAVNVLNNIHQYFPAVNWMGRNLLDSITDLSKSESREDLKVAAMSLMGALKRREKDWVLPQAFHLAPTENGVSTANGVRSASAKPSTPRPENDKTKNLNPKAPDFQPNHRQSVNGVSKLDGSSDRVDAEDGEIEDARMSDAPATNDAAAKAIAPPNEALGNTARPKIEPAPVSATGPLVAGSTQQQNLAPPKAIAEEPLSRPPIPEVKPAPTGVTQYSLPPMRPDMSRTASSGSANGRTLHNLPSKPEPSQVRAGDHRLSSRISDRGPPDHIREPRYPGRLDPSQLTGDRGLERTGPGLYSHSQDRTQGIERERVDQRWNNESPQAGRPGQDDRQGGLHGRDSRYPARDDRHERPVGDRQHADPYPARREADTLGPQSRDSTMPPPRSGAHQQPINPERAALIHGGHPPEKGASVNIHPDRRPDIAQQNVPPHHEHNSRGPSPARADDRRPARYENRRDDRPPIEGRRQPDESARIISNPPRYDETHAPTGPRTGRPGNNGPVSTNLNDRFRESMKPSPIAPPLDINHGRLSHDSSFPSRQAESQYGRLTSDNDIPSGPRLANGHHPPPSARGGRNVSAPQPHLNTQLPPQNHGPPTPVHDRQAPSGPSMRESPRRQPPFPHNPSISSAPPTPVAQSPDTAGIHPDRLKALQGPSAVTNEGSDQIRGDPQQAPPPVSMTPRGSISNQLPSPVGPPPNHRGPPTGPAMPNDRSGRDRRTFTSIQNIIQQGSGPPVPERSGQGASIRGRGGRANNVSGPSPVTSAPPTPGLPRQDQPPAREDLFAGRPNGQFASQQPMDDANSRDIRRGGPNDGLRDGDRRSGRHRSRSPGPDRSIGAPPRMREDEITHGRDNMRDRQRNNIGMPERDTRGASGPLETNIRVSGGAPERESRDRGPPRDNRRSGRDDGQYRDRRGELDQREGPDRRDDRERRDGGRKRGRGGDEGQGERNFSESKRPRR